MHCETTFAFHNHFTAFLAVLFGSPFPSKVLCPSRDLLVFPTSLVFQNHKFCKIRPKFLPIMPFLQESYEIVQKSQILQVCHSVEQDFLQESDNIFVKFVSICKKFLQKMRCVTSTKNSSKVFWTHFVSFLNNI